MNATDFLRECLKEVRIVADVEHKEEAEILNKLIPRMVDSLTDAEIIELYREALDKQGE